MARPEPKPDHIQFEAALLTAVGTAFEVLVAKGIASPLAIAHYLETIEAGFERENQRVAAGAIRRLKAWLAAPQRINDRKAFQDLLREPPKGSA